MRCPVEKERSLWPAVAVGIGLILLINGTDPYSNYVVRSSSFTREQFPFAVLLSLLFLVFVCNPLLRAGGRRAFGRRDLAAVVAIGLVGGIVPRMTGRMIPTITAPYYFGTPENEWPDYVWPRLNRWLAVEDAEGGVTAFYQGLAEGRPTPWAAWVAPMFWWSGLVAAILVMSLCVAVILRRQWADSERLTFPHAEISLLLAEEPGAGRRFPSYVYSRAFWVGFIIPCGMMLWNDVGFFIPDFPTLHILADYTLLTLQRSFPQLYLKFDFYVFCFAYFTPVNILFSLWFFHLLAVLQIGLSHRTGFGPSAPDAGMTWQNYWSIAVFVLWGLWVARRHLRDVARKALAGAGMGGRRSCESSGGVDDSGELISYRTACFGALLSLGFIVAWLVQAGMTAGTAVLLTGLELIAYLGMAKIVAMAGLVSLRVPMSGVGAFKTLMPPYLLTDGTIVVANLLVALWGGVAKGFFMPAAFNAVRLADAISGRKRELAGAILVGAVLSVVVCAGAMIALSYRVGAENFGSYDFTVGNRYTFDYIVQDLKGKTSPEAQPWLLGYGLAGGGVTALLIFLTYRFPRWPLHPLGFTISFAWPTRGSLLSIFLAWAFKSVVLRLGGALLYRQFRVVVIGGLLGYVAAVVLSFVVDLIFFHGQGHAVHQPPLV